MLVLFDVDGTLADTSALEGGVYERTFEAVFGAALPTADWTAYLEQTDRGVAEEAARRLGLPATRLGEFERRLVDEIERVLGRLAVAPVAGASRAFAVVEAAGHRAAVATGAYEGSARAKLAAVGVSLGSRVLVGCGFHPSRAAILREARRRAGPEGPAVYVGDGPWDLRAAGAAGLGFVGVDPRATGRLREAGAATVLPDLGDPARLLRAVEAAAR